MGAWRSASDERLEKSRRIADFLAAGVAVALPWSTSVVAVLIVAWLLVLIPTIRRAELNETLSLPVAYLPVALFALAVLGVLWSDVSWAGRLRSLSPYLKLLAVPLLIVQFRRSANGRWVLIGFLASCVALLIASTLTALFPSELSRFAKSPGIAVKDRISQSTMFLIAAFGFIYISLDSFRKSDRRWFVVAALLAAAFLLNIMFVSTSRTIILSIPIVGLVLLFCMFLQYRWHALLGSIAAVAVVSALIWQTSSETRRRVLKIGQEIDAYSASDARTSAGERIEFWKKSARFVAEAPLIGHGTGSTRSLFEKSASQQDGASGLVTANPHNQILAVAVQLGAVGVLALLAMWVAHASLFRVSGLAGAVVAIVLSQHLIGSLFNSHLFDFTHGWLYVIGTGVAAGLALRAVR
jgi:O-antigen ligase